MTCCPPWSIPGLSLQASPENQCLLHLDHLPHYYKYFPDYHLLCIRPALPQIRPFSPPTGHLPNLSNFSFLLNLENDFLMIYNEVWTFLNSEGRLL